MGHIHGVVVGTVKNVDDPNGEGRIRVEFPWMGGNNQSYWAPVATLMSGNNRGSWFMPEIGDEVLVAFDHDDVNHPFVLGFLWNGKDKPPETNTHKRLIKSVKGHSILLDDNDGSEKIEVTTSGNSKITMDDPNKSITITTSGGLKITMDDTSNSITIQASQQVAVKAPAIALGDGATQHAVWGDALYAYLQSLYTAVQSHMHVGELAIGIFPVTPMVGVPPPPPVPPKPAILSNVVTEA